MRKFLLSTRNSLSEKIICQKNKFEDFPLEILEEKAVWCGHWVKELEFPVFLLQYQNWNSN